MPVAAKKKAAKKKRPTPLSVKVVANVVVQVRDIKIQSWERKAGLRYRTLKVEGKEVSVDDCDGDEIARFRVSDLLKAMELIQQLHDDPAAVVEYNGGSKK